jgi:acetate kinase
MSQVVLSVNAGSSSLRLAALDVSQACPRLLLRARLDNREKSRRLEVFDAAGARLEGRSLRLSRSAGERGVTAVLAWFEAQLGVPIDAVGHRIVHGGQDIRPAAAATDAALRAAKDLAPGAPHPPLHQAGGLAGVAAVRRARPDLPQALVFDTSFHRGHDPVVDRLGLPHEWEARGLRRYGFHGLSYEYVAGRLRELDPAAAAGRVIAAHLGSGASLCAMRDGRSLDTTMGATPLDGLLMSTRCGNLDPGVVLYLQQVGGFSVPEMTDLLYRRSGLLGVSGLSADMRTLLGSDDPQARAAVELFVFRIAREASALAGTLGGLETLVFTGGVGENAPEIRRGVCERLAWLGADVDAAANARGDARISPPQSRLAVWVIPTDEEQVIARHTRDLLLPPPVVSVPSPRATPGGLSG